MNICIDIQAAIAQHAGVGRYTRQLVRHLGTSKKSGDHLTLFYFDFKRQGLSFEPGAADTHAVHFCPGRIAQASWKAFGWPPFNLFAPKADLYHFPNFIRPPLSRGKSVVTIHDMSFLQFPGFAEKRNLDYLSSRIHETAERADALITDSNFSAGEIQELLHVPREKIFPIHLGISEDFKAPPPDTARATITSLGINRPYILTVGTLEPRKNVEFIVEVFEKMTGFDGKLVIAGMRGWKYESALDRIRTSPRNKDILYIEYVDDSSLPSLYAGASLFVCASFYEGFGFPPLEAMACGTPVLSSSGGSLAEVLGNGAVILKEMNSDLWKTQAEKLLTDTTLRERLIAEGKKTAAKYTWTETAQKTWEVYKTVMKR